MVNSSGQSGTLFYSVLVTYSMLHVITVNDA